MVRVCTCTCMCGQQCGTTTRATLMNDQVRVRMSVCGCAFKICRMYVCACVCVCMRATVRGGCARLIDGWSCDGTVGGELGLAHLSWAPPPHLRRSLCSPRRGIHSCRRTRGGDGQVWCACQMTRIYIKIKICEQRHIKETNWLPGCIEVATISRLPESIRLFCKRALEKRLYSAKETWICKEPTNHSHPIGAPCAWWGWSGKIMGLFCKKALEKRPYSAKESYIFKERTNHCRPIGALCAWWGWSGRTHMSSGTSVYENMWNETYERDLLTFGIHSMGWLRLVGYFKLQVSFAEYRLFYRALVQKRPIILRSLLIVATP